MPVKRLLKRSAAILVALCLITGIAVPAAASEGRATLMLIGDNLAEGTSNRREILQSRLELALISGHKMSYDDGLAPDLWAIPEIDMADELGITRGTVYNQFRQPITRLAFAQLAVQTMSIMSGYSVSDIRTLAQYGQSFSDCNDPDVRVCNYLRIIDGYPDGSFKPNDAITRQAAAKILVQMAEAVGFYAIAPGIDFADTKGLWGERQIDRVSSYVNIYHNNTVVMEGVGGGRFDPNGSYTRQQAVVTMYRLVGAVTSFYINGYESDYIKPGVYTQNYSSGYSPILYLYEDSTFTMEVNLYEGTGWIDGIYYRSEDTVNFRVYNRNFSGFMGDDVDKFNMIVEPDGSLIYQGSPIGVTDVGSKFEVTMYY